MADPNKTDSNLQFVYEEDSEDKTKSTAAADVLSEDELSELEFGADDESVGLISTTDEAVDQSLSASSERSGSEDIQLGSKTSTKTVIRMNPVKKKAPPIKKETTSPSRKIKPKAEPSQKIQLVKEAEESRPVQQVQAVQELQAVQEVQESPEEYLEAREVQRPATRHTSELVDVDDLITADMRVKIAEIKAEAALKVAISEFKLEFLSQHLGESIALEFQIKQLLKPLLKTKNPAIANQIKKVHKVLEEHSKGSMNLIKKKAGAGDDLEEEKEVEKEAKVSKPKKIKKAS